MSTIPNLEQLINNAQPIGYKALVDRYKLCVLPHFRWSYLTHHGGRKKWEEMTPALYIYDKSYALEDDQDPLLHLEFSLKHEGLNLEIIKATFTRLATQAVETYVDNKPTSKYARMIWYLYETLTDTKLGRTDVTSGSYVDLLDPLQYYTTTPIKSSRHRINDNLLGNTSFCPLVRRTTLLEQGEEKRLDNVARAIIKKYPASIIKRAGYYLYAKETISSYEIEREQPDKKRMDRFINLLQRANSLGILTKQTLIELQNNIVDARFANQDYRTTQNYVGEHRILGSQDSAPMQHGGYFQKIHYISPKPEDVNILMQGLLDCLERMLNAQVHPVIIAAALSFGFVFIHPFDDGNGRLHRFLVHYILCRSGFTPPDMILPVSAFLLTNRKKYDEALESFSIPLLQVITDYTLHDDGRLQVNQKTKPLYQYIDYTLLATFLFDCIEKTVYADFKKELDYLIAYDSTKREIQEIVDMPDQQIDLFIALTTQNNGTLSKKKRALFSKLSPQEIQALEEIVQNYILSGK